MSHCPNCQKEETVVVIGMQNRGGYFVKELECLDCGAKWIEKPTVADGREFNG